MNKVWGENREGFFGGTIVSTPIRCGGFHPPTPSADYSLNMLLFFLSVKIKDNDFYII